MCANPKKAVDLSILQVVGAEGQQYVLFCVMCAGIECVKCGEFCHFECASQHSLFVASAVRAVDFECPVSVRLVFHQVDPIFASRTSLPSLSVSCAAPHFGLAGRIVSASLVLIFAGAVLRPRFNRHFTLVLAPSNRHSLALASSYGSSLADSNRPVGVLLKGRVITNELVAIISGRKVPRVSSVAVFTRSDGIHLDTSMSPLASCRIRRSLECGNCEAEDADDKDGTPIIAVYALRGIEDEELVLWEGRGRAKEGDMAVAGDVAELDKCECGCVASTVDLCGQAGAVLGRLEEKERQREEEEESEGGGVEMRVGRNLVLRTVTALNKEEATTRTEHQRSAIRNLREVVDRADEAGSDDAESDTTDLSSESRLSMHSEWRHVKRSPEMGAEGMEADREQRMKEMLEALNRTLDER
ncbi:Transmembrane amino acid transporter [Blattamonas nauphoetae]|uniref:Transmembrane amino acid transporter n=1 Tax=Blattamonas nauphoetae TaxID=2049346 RepID=A0ABQ9XMF9_9EUKA|nr:Transmembrane amino acid transporter [Blattamonas nauphoetae]